MDVVERFLASMTRHDWEEMARCVADDVHRVGPFGDAYDGRQDYVSFISGLLPSLPGYVMQVDRVTYVPGDRLAFAELSETVEMEGRPRRTPEVLVFGLDDDQLIRSIEIFIQSLPPGAPG